MIPIEISTPRSFSTSEHTIGLSCTFDHNAHNAADKRQTDRAIEIGRPRSGIGGLKSPTIHQW